MSDPVLLRGGGRWLLFDPATRTVHPLGNDPLPPGKPDPRIDRALRELLGTSGPTRTLAVTEASM
ncbi:MAG TPA: hypothetical protein VGV64_06625, partial [Thermoplasmata archaeon]|nr:hypothetical protein [Thermoplasmata archaeon]